MKKLIRNTLLAAVLLLTASATAGAIEYTIKQGVTQETVTYTTWIDLVNKIKTYTGTKLSPVEVEVTGLTLTKSDMGGRTAGGWIPGFIINKDNLSFTTITFKNCEFNTPDYPGLGFEAMRYPGNKLVFNSCNFYGYSIYGINSANEGNYAVDFEFLNCKFLNGAGVGGGGCWYGDMTIDGCEISGQINGTCGYDGHFRQNSEGESSVCSLSNNVFTNTSSGKMGVFANMFGTIKYKLAGDSRYTLLYKAKGYPIKVFEYLGTFAGGEECTLDTTDGEYFSLFAYALSQMFYDANGGSGTMTDPNKYIPGVDPVTLKANTFKRPGFVFTGWNTQADGKGTSYSAGQTITMPFGTNFTLYPQWEESTAAPGLTITANGLKENESAVFNVTSSASGSETVVLQVMLTGEAGDCASRTVLGLAPGEYKVVSAPWAWTYNVSPATKTVTFDGASPVEAEFTFEKKDPATVSPSVETLKVNEF